MTQWCDSSDAFEIQKCQRGSTERGRIKTLGSCNQLRSMQYTHRYIYMGLLIKCVCMQMRLGTAERCTAALFDWHLVRILNALCVDQQPQLIGPDLDLIGSLAQSALWGEPHIVALAIRVKLVDRETCGDSNSWFGVIWIYSEHIN